MPAGHRAAARRRAALHWRLVDKKAVVMAAAAGPSRSLFRDADPDRDREGGRGAFVWLNDSLLESWGGAGREPGLAVPGGSSGTGWCGWA